MWTIFHHLKHEHRYCKWVSDLYSPIFLSPRAVTTGRPPASWGQQLWSSVLGQARVSQEGAGSSLRHVFSGWRPRPNWRWPDAAPSPECAHASRFLRTTLASAVTGAAYMRWADTDQGGHRGLWGSSSHGQNIFRWGSLNFKTTGRTKQNYHGANILSL